MSMSRPERAGAAPSVSVVIPARNAAATLERALRSVFAQDPPPAEVVVVDDGSSDATAAVARAFDRRVRLVRTRDHDAALPAGRGAGAARARNLGMALASGDCIALLDADDEWLANKLAVQLDRLAARPDVVLVGSNFYWSRDGAITGTDFDAVPPGPEGAEAWRTLLAYSYLHTSTLLFRRAALDRCGGFDPALRTAEDQDFWIRLGLSGGIGLVETPLAIVHAGRGSLGAADPVGSVRDTMTVVRRHLLAQRARLSAAERRGILKCRHRQAARRLSDAAGLAARLGAIGHGLRALRYGAEPADVLSTLVLAVPGVRALKRRTRDARRRA